jgi:hypothetical protein
MSLRRCIFAGVVASTLQAAAGGNATLASGQNAQTAANASSPAHERLTVFEGVWTRADLPAGTTFRDTCEWLAGRRHMVCRQRSQSPTATREQLATYSYRDQDSTYLLTVLLSGGQVWRYEGRPEGERWVFNRVANRPDPPRRYRQILTPSAESIQFLEELSENGGPWRLTDPSEDFRYVRVRAVLDADVRRPDRSR